MLRREKMVLEKELLKVIINDNLNENFENELLN